MVKFSDNLDKTWFSPFTFLALIFFIYRFSIIILFAFIITFLCFFGPFFLLVFLPLFSLIVPFLARRCCAFRHHCGCLGTVAARKKLSSGILRNSKIRPRNCLTQFPGKFVKLL